jgi:hypothetical protein
MDYVKISEGRVIAGPGQLPPVAEGISGFHRLSDAELREHGWFPFEGSVPPGFDERSHKLVSHLHLGPVVRVEHVIEELSPFEVGLSIDAEKDRLQRAVRDLRADMEAQGVEYNGVVFKSDMEAWTAVFIAVRQGGTHRWKAKDGTWHDLTTEQMLELLDLIAEHRRKAFTNEDRVSRLIAMTSSLTEVDNIDLGLLWTLA